MRVLLDTHAFIWFTGADRRLGPATRRALDQPGVELVVSAVSIWEMAIKAGLGRLTLPLALSDYVAEKRDAGYRVLPISGAHAAAVAELPRHHGDPFDRMLAAQALAEQMPLVTRDTIFKKYGVKTIW